MKNKIRFIISRLLVVTAVVGIVSLIIGAIFKILLLATILFAVGSLVYSKIKTHKKNENYNPVFQMREHHHLYHGNQAIVPIQYASRASNPTIIPIY